MLKWVDASQKIVIFQARVSAAPSTDIAQVVSHPHRSQTKLQPLPISNFVLTSCLDAQFKFFEPVEKLSMPPVSYTLPQKSRISGHTVDLDSLEDRRLLGRV